jgi:hypothetical protein
VAGSILDIGQYITYLLLLSYLPIFIIFLIENAIPRDPTSHRYLMATILQGTPWHLWGTIRVLRHKRVKRHIKPVRYLISGGDVKPTSKLRPYLLPTGLLPFGLVVALNCFSIASSAPLQLLLVSWD